MAGQFVWLLFSQGTPSGSISRQSAPLRFHVLLTL
jgi:hypothetical protein